MKPQERDELERMIDRELKQLATFPAPETLVHRVMLAVHQRRRAPWWSRAWPEWPRLAQVLAVATLAVLALFAVVGSGTFVIGIETPALGTRVARWLAEWIPSWQTLSTLVSASGIVFRSAAQQLLLVSCACAFSAWLICVGLTTVCYRLTLQRA